MNEQCVYIDGSVHVPDVCKITSLKADNFKGFQDFSINFSPFTVVIGDNAVGKSSLLQLIAFLKYACTASVDEYMKDRGFTVDDIATKGLSKISRIMSFESVFSYSDTSLIWSISFLLDKANNRITLRSETVTQINETGKKVWLDYNQKKSYRLRIVKQEKDALGGEVDYVREPIIAGVYPCSWLKFIDARSGWEDYPVLLAIKSFFTESELLDLLAPQHMRKTVRGKGRTLGINGEKLPALIQQIPSSERKKLLESIQKVLPNMNDIRSVAGRAGWTHLETEESYLNRQVNIQASGISDGTLRLMAFFSLEFLNKSGGITLLDEIEDGINTSNIQSCIEYLRDYCLNNNQQLLLTTHSTVVLDYVESTEIRYMYKNKEGFFKCRDFEKLNEVKEKLSIFYPGEIILNTAKEELLINLLGDE